ncbi:hypothetical protein LEN26_015183 [Aphanomyces euteiches]|nr:hypothetical protein LEN26_015183 [Aphanomyces euteiches]KAH9108281.1 hypothetical protein AeMF1_016539 [Aphanomyces euteiches]KAH9181040.1 hypothetical protein AeNC1_016984 [Aphanomyces euteiches]
MIAPSTDGFLNLKDLLTLSMVSRSFYYTMNHDYWEKIVQAPMFESMYKVAAFAKMKPRQRAVRIMERRLCTHCRQVQPYDIRPLRPRLEAFMVCDVCAELPPFAEIRYKDVMKQYGLKRKQLEAVPSRTEKISRGHLRLFKLKDILELVEKVRESTNDK